MALVYDTHQHDVFVFMSSQAVYSMGRFIRTKERLIFVSLTGSFLSEMSVIKRELQPF